MRIQWTIGTGSRCRTMLTGCASFGRSEDTVSYTHLDVYKRQVMHDDDTFTVESLSKCACRGQRHQGSQSHRDVYKRQIIEIEYPWMVAEKFQEAGLWKAALTAAPITAISSLVGITSKTLPWRGVILTISCRY